MFNLYSNPNFYANPNPNPAMSHCYLKACRIPVSGCSGISMVSMIRVRVKVRVMD